MANLEVLNPVAQIERHPDVKLAPRLNELSGKTIGLHWNFKPSGDILNHFTAELLSHKFKDVNFKNYTGSIGDMIRRASPNDIDKMAKECAAVIGSHGD